MNIILSTIGTLQNPKESAHITTINLAKELQTIGHQVYIITEKVSNQPTQTTIDNITIYRPYRIPLLSKLLSHPLTIRTLRKEKNIKIDIIHSMSATPLFILNTLIAKILTPHAKIIHSLKSYPRSKLADYGYFLLNFADAIVVPTNTHAQKLRFVQQHKIHILPSPIDTTKFHPQPKLPLKKKYGLQHKTILFYYGALWENKGINDLIRALPEIIKSIPTAHLIIAPRYQNITAQQSLITTLHLQNHITFLLKDITIEDYVNLADLSILPYKNLTGTDGTPSCLLESMAAKTPIVTTELPELQEIAKDLVHFAKPNNLSSLASTIISALNNPNPAQIEKAYHHSKQFSNEKIAKRIEEIYKHTTK